jgi:aspartyl-tRNA(Asn)/glutamyl-tRNA(Gln) amidotransferase subunit C
MSGNFNIQEVAKLALIKLNQGEVEKLSKDLEIILEHVDTLSKLEIDDSEVSIHPLGIDLILREDQIEDGLSHDESISNAPEKQDGYFKVPPAME